MNTGLIAALATAAREAREENGVSPEQVAVALGKSVETVHRFERAEPFAGLELLYDAYEEATGVSLCDLLDEAKSNLKKKG